MQTKIIIMFIISPLMGERSASVGGSLGMLTVSESDAITGTAKASIITRSNIAEKTRFKPKIHLPSIFSLLYYNTKLTICQQII